MNDKMFATLLALLIGGTVTILECFLMGPEYALFMAGATIFLMLYINIMK